MAMTATERHDIVSRGERIYQEGIRPHVETAENIGKEIVIDVESGDYEFDRDGMKADGRLRTRRPNGIFYGARIGYDAAYTIGGVLKRTADQ